MFGGFGEHSDKNTHSSFALTDVLNTQARFVKYIVEASAEVPSTLEIGGPLIAGLKLTAELEDSVTKVFLGAERGFLAADTPIVLTCCIQSSGHASVFYTVLALAIHAQRLHATGNGAITNRRGPPSQSNRTENKQKQQEHGVLR